MAKSSSSQITLVLFLTLAVALTTTTSGFLIKGIRAKQVRILGVITLDIPPPAPPAGSRPILNALNAGTVCNGSRVDLAGIVSDVNGFYEIVINSADTILFDAADCFISVRLPIARARIFPPTGILRATFTFVRFLQPISNGIAIFTAGPLSLVT